MAYDLAAPEPGRSAGTMVGYVLVVLLGIAALVVLFGQRGDLEAARHQFRHLNIGQRRSPEQAVHHGARRPDRGHGAYAPDDARSRRRGVGEEMIQREGRLSWLLMRPGEMT